MDKLKPCPFCGEDEMFGVKKRTYDGKCEALVGKIYWYVECYGCDARTACYWEGDIEIDPDLADYFNSAKEMAVYNWNRRKPDAAALEKRCAELEEIILYRAKETEMVIEQRGCLADELDALAVELESGG